MEYMLWHRQQQTIAQGALTNSKHPRMHVMGVFPTHAAKSKGCHIWDEQGRQYIDYICGLGTNLLGYGHGLIKDYVIKHMDQGTSPSLPTPLEAQAVEELRTMLPHAERVKWLKTGSEACAAALIIARAYTGRSLVLSDAYHGWSNEFVSLTPPAHGCPPNANIQKLTQTDSFKNVAAIIIEPVITDYSNERKQWLYKLMETAKRDGALVIFDEVITGFRFHQYFVSRWLNVEPDLMVLGKAIANGFPLSAVTGRKEIMDGDYFVSSTYAGDTVSLAAAVKTMNLMRTEYKIERLISDGQDFIDRFNKICPEVITIEGYPTRGVFKAEPMAKALFFQEMAIAGVLFCSSWFYNYDLMEHKKSVLSIAKQVLLRIKCGEVKLKGKMPESPFATKVREAST